MIRGARPSKTVLEMVFGQGSQGYFSNKLFMICGGGLATPAGSGREFLKIPPTTLTGGQNGVSSINGLEFASSQIMPGKLKAIANLLRAVSRSPN